jgi:hypothetical protein
VSLDAADVGGGVGNSGDERREERWVVKVVRRVRRFWGDRESVWRTTRKAKTRGVRQRQEVMEGEENVLSSRVMRE